MRKILFAVTIFAIFVVGPIIVGAFREYAQAPATEISPPTSLSASVQRIEHRFPCADTQCAGVLYLPNVPKPPVIVMAGGFAGTQDVALPGYAIALAESGIAVFTFDYRYFGVSGGSPRQLVNPWHQLDDWGHAISYVAGIEAIDGKKITLLGASLGGGHALIMASRKKEVTAVIALVPLVDPTIEGSAAEQDPAQIISLLFDAWRDLWLAAFGGEPVTLKAIAKKGEYALLSDDAAYAAFETLASQSKVYRNEVVARSIFTFDDYNPAVLAHGLAKPLLTIASRADRFAPFEPAEKFSKNHRGILHEVSCDHFEVYGEQCATGAKSAIIEFVRNIWK